MVVIFGFLLVLDFVGWVFFLGAFSKWELIECHAESGGKVSPHVR